MVITTLSFYGQLWIALIRWLAPARIVSVSESGDRDVVAVALLLRVSRRIFDGVASGVPRLLKLPRVIVSQLESAHDRPQ
jgi:hypothetical protein